MFISKMPIPIGGGGGSLNSIDGSFNTKTKITPTTTDIDIIVGNIGAGKKEVLICITYLTFRNDSTANYGDIILRAIRYDENTGNIIGTFRTTSTVGYLSRIDFTAYYK